MLKKGIAAICAVCLLTMPAHSAMAAANTASGVSPQELSFSSYTYDIWNHVVSCPNPYTFERRITGLDLGLGDFGNVNDLFADTEGRVYLALSGSNPSDNRIVVMDSTLHLLSSAEGYIDKDGKSIPFSEPMGIYVKDNGDIYVADGTSKQIYHMDGSFHIKQIIKPPSPEDSSIISDEFVDRYRPSKLVVDATNRIYLVAINVNEGIIEFDADGKFEGFLAAGKVNHSPLELLWRRFSTKAQLARMQDFVPVEYNNIDLDNEGFIFTTLSASNENTVKNDIKSKHGSDEGALVRRLNLLGNDILKHNGYGPPVGDLDIDTKNEDTGYSGISKITDVTCGPDGTYTLLDNNRNHIFTYDSDGYLLYAFEGPDAANGGFRTPSAIAQCGKYLYVADTGTRSLTLLGQTDYARSIMSAIDAENSGDIDTAETCWNDVLAKNGNYDLAYTGLGKIAYQKGQYSEALSLLKKSNNSTWYSKAYKQYRTQAVVRYLAPVMEAVIGVVILFVIYKIFQKVKRRRGRGK